MTSWRGRLAALSVIVAFVLVTPVAGQRRGGGPFTPPTPRAAAPVDLTGYWVSIVNEDWRYRMSTPAKGDVGGVPLNGAGRGAAATWDPARERSGRAMQAIRRGRSDAGAGTPPHHLGW